MNCSLKIQIREYFMYNCWCVRVVVFAKAKRWVYAWRCVSESMRVCASVCEWARVRAVDGVSGWVSRWDRGSANDIHVHVCSCMHMCWWYMGALVLQCLLDFCPPIDVENASLLESRSGSLLLYFRFPNISRQLLNLSISSLSRSASTQDVK